MKKTIIFSALVLTAGCFAVNTACAQIQWTPEQKAVWKTETTMRDLSLKGEDEKAWSYIDDSYQGWRNDIAVPRSKEARIALTKSELSQGAKVLYVEISPVDIWVKGNYAYVDYFFNTFWKNGVGKEMHSHGRSMDVLMKEGDKWMLVGDSGGADATSK